MDDDLLTCTSCGAPLPADCESCPDDGTPVQHRDRTVIDHDHDQTVLHDRTVIHRLDELESEPLEPTPLHAVPFMAPASDVGSNTESGGTTEDTVPRLDPLVGIKLGDYVLHGRIGMGAVGLVYEGLHPQIGKRVAVKVLKPELAEDPHQVALLLAEARAVNAIHHRNIIDIFGFGQLADGRQYIVMEYLEGQGLDRHLEKQGRLPHDEALWILDEVLAALAAAHGAGVVHRDLKPSNIFLVQQPDGSRYIKLLDFGVAQQQPQRSEASSAFTQTQFPSMVGTPQYMAPELIRGESVGPATDLYALGVIAFEMLTGVLPFAGDTPWEQLAQHVDSPAPALSSRVEGISSELDAFVLQLLAKEQEQRPSSAEAVRAEIAALRDLLPPSLPESETSAEEAPSPFESSVTMRRKAPGGFLLPWGTLKSAGGGFAALVAVGWALTAFFRPVVPVLSPAVLAPPPAWSPAPVSPPVQGVVEKTLAAPAPPVTLRPRSRGEDPLFSRLSYLERNLNVLKREGKLRLSATGEDLMTLRARLRASPEGEGRQSVAHELAEWEHRYLIKH